MKRWIIRIVTVLIMLAGLSVFLYPTASNYIANRQQSAVIQNYKKEVNSLDEEERQAELQRARDYNETLIGKVVVGFMPGEAVPRIFGVVYGHQPVARNFGKHRRRRYRKAQRVAFDYAFLRDIYVFKRESVDK